MLILIFTTLCFGQKSFKYKTQYKKITETTIEKSNYTFIYDENLKQMKMINDNLSLIQNFPVNFLDSRYSEDGKGYLIGYSGDLNRMHKKGLPLNKLPLFTFIFDKKLGNLIWIKIDYANLHPEKWESVNGEMFYTEYGLKFKEKNFPEDGPSFIATPTN